MTDISGTGSTATSEHAFLDLGERLRQRGQHDAALSVALAGVARFPGLAAAHDLLGRIRADQGDDEGARSAWVAALECAPGMPGALKGLAFLAFRRRDFAEAERRLEAAAAEAPRDAAILAALDRIRAARPASDDTAVGFDDPAAGLLLIDSQGLRMAGGVGPGDTGRLADATAATATGVARESRRTAQLLGLGAWRHLLIEGERNRVVLLPVAPHGALLVRRSAAAPVGRMLALADRAAIAARRWLGADT
jgi:predicted regulator of Ras-like GTPase activity (Roadblock/LC7/MglB family)